jgi:hypothetical protein
LCRHDEITTELQHKVVETRQKTNEELMDFNAQLNLIIKDEDIRLTLTNINKITKKGKK